MIRKLLIFSIAAIVVFWFACAHLIKSKLTRLIEEIETDNINLKYTEAVVAGFPFKWEVVFKEPVLSLVDSRGLHEFKLQDIHCEFDYKLKSLAINFGNKIESQEVKDEVVLDYIIKSDSPMLAHIKLDKSVYSINSPEDWIREINEFNFDLERLICTLRGKELFSLSAFKVFSASADNERIDSLRIKISADYHSAIRYWGAEKANLSLDLSYLINKESLVNSPDLGFERKFEFTSAMLKLDQASLAFNGVIKLTRRSLPSGEFNVVMVHYQDIIDTIIPQNFPVSPVELKKIIYKATHQDVATIPPLGDQMEFRVSLSDKGVYIGNLNLLEQKM